MYFSRIQLSNWRSYEDASFEFHKPSRNKPITLIGAMNGHGKTSFLVSLYLGLYGRYGLRYCEGFSSIQDDKPQYYKQAVESFRRRHTNKDEPTEVEIEFERSPFDNTDAETVRIVRRWFFTANGKARQGDGFEEADLYIDGRPIQKPSGLDTVSSRLEKVLFPPRIMPAFFFDGEQAQTLVNRSGEEGIQKAVEVMYGTKELAELSEQLKSYITHCSSKHGGKKHTSSKHAELERKLRERENINRDLATKQGERERDEAEKESLIRERDRLTEHYSLSGGDQALNFQEIAREYAEAESTRIKADAEASATAKELGIALATSRLATTVLARLASEELRESWEGLRDGTIDKREEVLGIAMPVPKETDSLLSGISKDSWAALRERFTVALEAIYNPPPEGCADHYLFGHAKGDTRQIVVESITRIRDTSSSQLTALAKRLREARDRFDDAKARFDRLSRLPRELEELQAQLKEINEKINLLIHNVGHLDNEIRVMKADHRTTSQDITRLQDEITRMEPEMKRTAVAERTSQAIEAMLEQMAPITTNRLKDEITRYFKMIADDRFKDCRVEFIENKPELLFRDGTHQPIDMMSGFERRSFGISFSLALASITQHRLPLVVDTPLGNADSEYRPRLLDSLSRVDLDQIILLTHDQEITPVLAADISNRTNGTFLIRYDSSDEASHVIPDKFFWE